MNCTCGYGRKSRIHREDCGIFDNETTPLSVYVVGVLVGLVLLYFIISYLVNIYSF